MPFGVQHDDIVIIDKTTGPRAHLFDHSGLNDLINQHRAGYGLEIKDAHGLHYYPYNAVLGLHFETAPNHQTATVQLWQDNRGIGQPGTPGSARLYLVDPDRPGRAWPLRTELLTPRFTFRTLAAQLVTDTALLISITKPSVPTDSLDHGAHVATWHHTTGHVEILTEHRTNTPGPVPIAGDAAASFIGLDDMNTDARTR